MRNIERGLFLLTTTSRNTAKQFFNKRDGVIHGMRHFVDKITIEQMNNAQ
jgi:hypothetical protein